MKTEIASIEHDTRAALDRAIMEAEAASQTGGTVATELVRQREQMGKTEAELRQIGIDVKDAEWNLKHGFSLRGAITGALTRGRRGRKRDKTVGSQEPIAAVFSSSYSQSPKKGDPKIWNEPKDTGGVEHARSQTGLSSSLAAGRYDDQMDKLDGLLDGLVVQSKKIGEELRQQSDGIEVLGEGVIQVETLTKAQNETLRSRFKIKDRLVKR
ncbi:unnamed protein product [Choristocarpus tenellus]